MGSKRINPNDLVGWVIVRYEPKGKIVKYLADMQPAIMSYTNAPVVFKKFDEARHAYLVAKKFQAGYTEKRERDMTICCLQYNKKMLFEMKTKPFYQVKKAFEVKIDELSNPPEPLFSPEEIAKALPAEEDYRRTSIPVMPPVTKHSRKLGWIVAIKLVEGSTLYVTTSTSVYFTDKLDCVEEIVSDTIVLAAALLIRHAGTIEKLYNVSNIRIEEIKL